MRTSTRAVHAAERIGEEDDRRLQALGLVQVHHAARRRCRPGSSGTDSTSRRLQVLLERRRPRRPGVPPASVICRTRSTACSRSPASAPPGRRRRRRERAGRSPPGCARRPPAPAACRVQRYISWSGRSASPTGPVASSGIGRGQEEAEAGLRGAGRAPRRSGRRAARAGRRPAPARRRDRRARRSRSARTADRARLGEGRRRRSPRRGCAGASSAARVPGQARRFRVRMRKSPQRAPAARRPRARMNAGDRVGVGRGRRRALRTRAGTIERAHARWRPRSPASRTGVERGGTPGCCGVGAAGKNRVAEHGVGPLAERGGTDRNEVVSVDDLRRPSPRCAARTRP